MSEISLTSRIEDELKAGTLELPAFNTTALKLQRMLGDAECDIEAVAELIRQDPALASRILTMANSSFYAGLSKVDTVSRAIVRLGTQKVMNLAMAAASRMAMSSPDSMLNEYLNGLWLRSFVCAQACRWLAEASGDSERGEIAFLAGLLHDLGELFLLRVLEKFLQDESTSLELTPQLVDEVLAVLHARMGHALMQSWGLPEIYAQICLEHHRDEVEPGQEMIALVRLADLATRKAGIGQSAEPDLVLAVSPEAQLLGLSEIQLAQFEVQLDDALEMARGSAG